MRFSPNEHFPRALDTLFIVVLYFRQYGVLEYCVSRSEKRHGKEKVWKARKSARSARAAGTSAQHTKGAEEGIHKSE